MADDTTPTDATAAATGGPGTMPSYGTGGAVSYLPQTGALDGLGKILGDQLRRLIGDPVARFATGSPGVTGGTPASMPPVARLPSPYTSPAAAATVLVNRSNADAALGIDRFSAAPGGGGANADDGLMPFDRRLMELNAPAAVPQVNPDIVGPYGAKSDPRRLALDPDGSMPLSVLGRHGEREGSQ